MANAPVPMIPRPFSQPGLTLNQIISILWARRRFIVNSVIATTLLAVVISLLQKNRYEAMVSLLVDFQVSDPLTGRDFPIGLTNSYLATQVEMINNSRTLQDVVAKLELTADEEFTDGYHGEGGPDGLRHWAEKTLREHLLVTRGFDSRFIYITAEADDADKAALIANTVAEAYLQQYRALTSDPAVARSRHYRSQLADLRAEVDAAQDKLSAFRAEAGLIDTADNPGMEENRLLSLSAQLVEAQRLRREAEQRRARVGNLDNNVLDSQLIQQLKVQLATLQAQYAELGASLGSRHPDLVSLEEQIAAAQGRLDAETARYSAGAQADLTAARSEEKQLTAAVEQQRAKVAELRQQQDQASRYERELASAKQIYDRALTNYDQVLFDANSNYTNIMVSSPATRPLKKSSPKRTLNVLIGMFAGGFLGVTGALIAELLQRKIRCRDDLELDLGIPVLIELRDPTPAMTASRWAPRLPRLS